METWRILVFIAILAVLSIGAWYVIKLKWEELREQLYVYPKNGHHYLPLRSCRMKCPTTGQWFDALIYQDYDSKHLYVREKKDFFDKFVKLIDWKDEKGDTNRESKES